jgi:hypothetical protein
MNEIIVSINRNRLLSKKITFTKYLIMDTIDFNKHVHDIDISINEVEKIHGRRHYKAI